MRDWQRHTVRNGELQVEVIDEFDGHANATLTFVPVKDAPPLAKGALKSIVEKTLKGHLDIKVESHGANQLAVLQNTLPENLKAGEFGDLMDAAAAAIGREIFMPSTVRVGGAGKGKSPV